VERLVAQGAEQALPGLRGLVEEAVQAR